jgi:pimeloyl-ACP methyl ester carboxylesterase
LSSKPAGGFDKKTQAADVDGVLNALGLQQADVVVSRHRQHGGVPVRGTAPGADVQAGADRCPGAGVGPWDEVLKNPLLWHFRFGGPDVERLVAGRERTYLDRFWNEFSASPDRFGESARRHYARLYALPGAMHSGFAQFAAFDQDAIDNREFLARDRLKMPILALAGEKSFGPTMAAIMRAAGDDVTQGIVPASGHWIMEENPRATIELVRDFLTR